MKLDLNDISKIVEDSANIFTLKSTANSDSGNLPEPPSFSYRYIIADISDFDLQTIEDQTLIASGVLLKAVLKFEFWDDDFDFKHIPNHINDPADGNAALVLDSWYSENVERLHETFEFLRDMRPSVISDCVVVRNQALLEICTALTEEAEEELDDPALHLEAATSLMDEEDAEADGEGDE